MANRKIPESQAWNCHSFHRGKHKSESNHRKVASQKLFSESPIWIATCQRLKLLWPQPWNRMTRIEQFWIAQFQIFRIANSIRGRKKHINFFNINFLPPTQNPPFCTPPPKKLMCLISWERMQKRDPHKLFRGDLWGQKRGPKRAIFGHKKFSLLFFSSPYQFPPAPGSVKALLFPPLLNKVENKGMQGVRARYDTELPPIISIVRYPGRPVILGMELRFWDHVNLYGAKIDTPPTPHPWK